MEQLILQYYNINKEIIEVLSKNIEEFDYNSLDECIIKKQEIINTIETKEKNFEELRKSLVKYNLMESEKKISLLANEKKDLLKEKMEKINKNRIANNQYNNTFLKNPYFIDNKI